MIRTFAVVACLLLPAVAAAAQTPVPPAPPAAPVPSVPPPAPVAPVPPTAPVAPESFPAPMPQVPEGFPAPMPFEWQALELSRSAIERARADVERVKADMERAQFNVDLTLPSHPEMEFALADAADQIKNYQALVVPGDIRSSFRTAGESGLYSSGLQALGRHQYERAVTIFDQVVARKDTRADAALYWKAFAQFKAARASDAQATLAALRRDHPSSRYLVEAKVLEAEIRRQAGQSVNVEDQAVNDDIKILAIQSMQRTDPARALPLLEGVLNSANSLEVKRRAVYVLALSDDPRGREILLRYAKGAGSPDLQPEAIRYLASRRDRATTSADLREIYESTEDPSLRRIVIEAYRASGDKSALLAVINNPGNAIQLRQSAITGLSNLAAPQELMALYQKETDPALRTQIVSVLASMAAVDQLADIARTDQDAAVRQRAIRSLGGQRPERTGQPLITLYSGTQDDATRSAIIQALGQQNNAEGLVTIARKETRLELKKQIVSQLSRLAAKSPAAADYMMEMLKP